MSGYSARELLSGYGQGLRTGILFLALCAEIGLRRWLRPTQALPDRVTSFMAQVNGLTEAAQGGYYSGVATWVTIVGVAILALCFRS